MRLLNKIIGSRSVKTDASPSTTAGCTVITFTGGMGAQIISAAVYHYLKNAGERVYADLTYFDRTPHLATPGKHRDLSYWPWQLDVFGLSPTSFEILHGYNRREVKLIEDGREKLELAMKALALPEIHKHFVINEKLDDILPAYMNPDYLCIHVRRGDYVNVAAHLVSDNQFISISRKFSGLLKSMVVVSDSPIEEGFRRAISSGFEQAEFLDNIDATASHRIMRNARILICSNSQFSLVAAMLNSQALVVMPKQWFGEKNRALETPFNEACDFQILH